MCGSNQYGPAQAGEEVTYWISANGPVTLKLLSGALPPGLSLSPDGTIVGTPVKDGTYTFTVRADDEEGGFGIGAITIRIGGTAGQNRMLPAATVGKPYTADLRGSVLAPGESLPPGLTLSRNGTLSGTPTDPWLYRFSVLLQDVVSSYTLEVLTASPTP